jgi:parallel beta-helix repeat protein
MSRKLLLGVLLVLFLVVAVSPEVELAKAEHGNIVVPNDYSTIQEAVDAAHEGDTVFVKSGFYNESVAIHKQISLVGEDPETTVIVGDYRLNGTVVLIRHNNVSITGFTVQPYAYSFSRKGIHLLHVSYCSVIGNIFLENGYGVWLYGASENNITGNTINGPTGARSKGIMGEYSPNNWISDNIVTDNQDGILIWDSDGNTFCDNTIINNYDSGFNLRSNGNIVSGNVVSDHIVGMIVYGTNNTLRGNRIDNSGYSFELDWGSDWVASDFVNDIDSSNTINGKSITYWVNKQDQKVPEDTPIVVLVNCTNITVENLELTDNKQGIILVATTNSTIQQNSVQVVNDAILLYGSSNNKIANNLVFDKGTAIHLISSFQNTVTGNSITDTNTAMWIEKSNENTIKGNIISENSRGIRLDASNNNQVFNNSISESMTGIWFWNHASENVFYLNNLIDNKWAVEKYVTDFQQFPRNIWDNGTVGNFWTDYNGTDANSDGIGDTPYTIDENNQDNYPLIEPAVIPEFPSWTILPLIIAATLTAIIVKKKLQKI